MVCGSMSRKRKLFNVKPMTTVDNYFFRDAVIYWDGNVGLGIIGKNTRNRLPTDIEPLYLHKENMNATMKHTKA